MAGFADGFVRGFQLVDTYQRNQELMSQRREDRKRDQYGRDLEALMNDWQNTKGDLTDEEFAQTDAFSNLAKRHRNSAIFDSAINQGITNGNTVKLKQILKNPETKMHIMIVDTYDKNGKLVSQNRPVTESRASREDNPNDPIIQASGSDLYQGMLGALQQSPDYIDQRGRADRFDATIDALDPPDPAGLDTDTVAPQKVAADPLAPAPKDDVERQNETDAFVKGVQEEAVEQGIDDDFQPGIDGPRPQPGEPGFDPNAAQTSAVEGEEQSQAVPLPDPVALEERFDQLAAQRDELDDIDMRHSGQMTRPQWIEHRRKLMAIANEQAEVREQLDALTGSSTARRAGASLSEVPGEFIAGVGEFGEAIANIPAVKGVTDVVYDFFGGLRNGTGIPPPDGTTQTERFEHGAQSQANAATRDQNKPFGGANIKPKTTAASAKIAAVNEATALKIANQQKLSRKMMGDYRKALRAQVLYGDISVKDATSSYYAVLKGNKDANKWKIHLDTKNGVMFRINEGDGEVLTTKYADGTDNGKSAADRQKFQMQEYKQMEAMVDIITRGDDNAKADMMAIADQSRDAMGIIMSQPGAHSVLQQAYGRWKGAVSTDTTAFGFQWLGTTPGEAKQKHPSLSPFIAAQVLGMPDDPQLMNDYAGRLAYANGGNRLTEEDWVGVTEAAQFFSEQGLGGEAAMEKIIQLYSEFQGQ